MKKLVVFSLALVLSAGFAFAQNSILSNPNPETIDADSAMQALREVSVNKFKKKGS